ncbi:hypothetical protein [Bradyrhizobium manausense]|uniref:hypothetical protein n=1 Tax=Bradyrhizobium manausense TaxID=989370 RepID=UPI0012EE6072|nr:hypothetical protein [Bradyrhizobium manausense]
MKSLIRDVGLGATYVAEHVLDYGPHNRINTVDELLTLIEGMSEQDRDRLGAALLRVKEARQRLQFVLAEETGGRL